LAHLNRLLLDALLRGDATGLPADLSALKRHLEAGCSDCDAILAGGPDLDTLLRLLEAQEALVALEARPEDRFGAEHQEGQALSTMEREALWERIQSGERRPLGDVAEERVSGRSWMHFLPPAVGIAAVAVVGVLWLRASPEGPPSSDAGVKGDGASPEIQLSVVAGRDAGGSFELDRRVTDGDHLPSSDTLLFELATDRSSARYLFAQDENGRVTFLLPPPAAKARMEEPGLRRVQVDGRWVALDLGDLAGSVRLVAAASSTEIESVDAAVIVFWDHARPAGFSSQALSLVVDAAPAEGDAGP
jgi:hypothetical protein